VQVVVFVLLVQVEYRANLLHHAHQAHFVQVVVFVLLVQVEHKVVGDNNLEVLEAELAILVEIALEQDGSP
jgi:hypothetical protein